MHAPLVELGFDAGNDECSAVDLFTGADVPVRAGASTATTSSSRRVLLSSAADLCDAFYHVKDTPEAGVCKMCVLEPSGCCSGKTTCCIHSIV